MAEEIKKEVTASEEFKTRPVIIKDLEIIKYPIATEATQKMQFEENALTFAVSPKANKLEIKRAIQAIFGAKVVSVNTINVPRRAKRVGRYSGFLPAYKKAIVRFDSSFDLGKIAEKVNSGEMTASEEEK